MRTADFRWSKSRHRHILIVYFWPKTGHLAKRGKRIVQFTIGTMMSVLASAAARFQSVPKLWSIARKKPVNAPFRMPSDDAGQPGLLSISSVFREQSIWPPSAAGRRRYSFKLSSEMIVADNSKVGVARNGLPHLVSGTRNARRAFPMRRSSARSGFELLLFFLQKLTFILSRRRGFIPTFAVCFKLSLHQAA